MLPQRRLADRTDLADQIRRNDAEIDKRIAQLREILHCVRKRAQA